MRRTLAHLPSPALVVAVVALFVALGGVGYAAFKLPKNSVHSRNIVNGQVRKADVSDGLRKELRTTAVEKRTDFVTFTGGAKTTVVSMRVRRGTYLLIGKVHLANDGATSTYVFCELKPSAIGAGSSGAMVGPGSHRVSVPLLATHTFRKARKVSIKCDPTNPDDEEIGTSTGNKLVALRISSAKRVTD